MAKSEEWRRGFQSGSLVIGCIFLVGFLVSLWVWFGVMREVREIHQASMTELQGSLTKCQEISKGNYAVATRAQEENRQLRSLVAEYQAQIQKGQAPAGLAEFLLKLLIK